MSPSKTSNNMDGRLSGDQRCLVRENFDRWMKRKALSADARLRSEHVKKQLFIAFLMQITTIFCSAPFEVLVTTRRHSAGGF